MGGQAIVTVAQPTHMRLRVPCWSEHAIIRIGQAPAVRAPPCAFYNISKQQLLDQRQAPFATATAADSETVSVNVTFVNKIRLHGNHITSSRMISIQSYVWPTFVYTQRGH